MYDVASTLLTGRGRTWQLWMGRRTYAGRKDVLKNGIPKPLFAFAGVAIGLTTFIVLRVVLNPWGVNPSGSETQRVKAATTIVDSIDVFWRGTGRSMMRGFLQSQCDSWCNLADYCKIAPNSSCLSVMT